MALSYEVVKSALDTSAAQTGGKFVAFDAAYYVANYSIVRDANGAVVDSSLSSFAGDPLQHYVEQGAAKGYMPNAWFDPVYYRSQYSDTGSLAAADLIVHYAVYGVNEGRAPTALLENFNGDKYLADNPDVLPYVTANLDSMFGGSTTNGAIAHYLKFGAGEGRKAYDQGGGLIPFTTVPAKSTIAGTHDDNVTTVSLNTNGGDTLLTGSKAMIDGGDGTSVLRLIGDADLRIDMTNAANQVRGIDLNGDGTIAANGVENNVSGAGIATFKNFEVIDAYARNPLNEGDASKNYLGDIKYSGTGVGGDGVSTNGNIYLGGLGHDEVLAGIGNDFLVGGGLAGRAASGLPSGWVEWYDWYQFQDGQHLVADFLSGGRNADFFYGEFASLDNVDGAVNFFDGGTTADDTSAGQNSGTEEFSSQDSDWLLLEIADDEEYGEVVLDEDANWDGDGPHWDYHPSENWSDHTEVAEYYGGDGWVAVGDGKRLRGILDDIENVDASGNLYGFLTGFDIELGGRRDDDRDGEGTDNYGIGSSGQLRIFGSDESNKLIGGYDNDHIWGGEGNDLLMGGNMQFFSQTVPGGVTNPNLAAIWNDGRDELLGGSGDDDILFETDGGIYEGGDDYNSDTSYSDTLWVTDFVFGTRNAGSMTTDGVVRLDLGNGQYATDPDNFEDLALNYKGYGGADQLADTGNYTADQTNYVEDTARAQVQDFQNVIATGLGNIDYKAAGSNSPELAFDNQQNFYAYEGDMDLRGSEGANILYANTGDDVIEGREGDDKLSGGSGNDDFYFELSGGEGSQFEADADFCADDKGRSFWNYVPDSGEGIDVIHRQQDLNGDNLWDRDSKGDGLYMQDFGLDESSQTGTSVLAIAVFKAGGNNPGDELIDVVNRVSEIRTGVKVDGVFQAIVLNTDAIKAATTYAGLEAAINAALDATAFGADLSADLQSDGITIHIIDAKGRELADAPSEVGAGVDVSQKANTQTENVFVYGPPAVTVSQDRIIYKAYEDRTDNEGVDDDSVFGSTISLGMDNYAEDLVVDFQADASGTTGTTTYLAEDQAWTVKFSNLTTQDKVTVSVNGVSFSLQVGKDLSGNLIGAEDTVTNSQAAIQTAFIERLAAYITGMLDDDTAAGGLDVLANKIITGDAGTPLDPSDDPYYVESMTIVPRDYDAEEVVFIRKPVVTLTNLSGGEPASAKVSNNAQHELQLYQFDGRDNALNDTNVLFWGEEAVQRANLETAKTVGGALTGTDALVIDSGKDDLAGIAYNRTTSFATDFAVHGDDQFFGAAGNDTIKGLTGDDRTYMSRGTDSVDGGKDLYKVLKAGASEATVEQYNDYDAAMANKDAANKSVTLILQTEDGSSLVSDSSPSEGYFRDTLIAQQRDFGNVGVGGSTFTVTMSSDLDKKLGGAGTVEVFEAGVKTGTTSFVEMENIRTVAGDGTWAGQGNDTLNVAALSTATEAYDTVVPLVTTNGGLTYYLTNDSDAGDIVVNYTGDVYAKVDGVENVIYGNGDDETYIDETEAGKDNRIDGGLGNDRVNYEHDELCCELLPMVTLAVESSSNTDTITMTDGALGLDEPVDTLVSIETIDAWDLAIGPQQADVLDVSNVNGAIVDFHGVDPIIPVGGKASFSAPNVRTDEASDSVLVTVRGMSEFEKVMGSSSADTVIVADEMENESCAGEGDLEEVEFDSILNFDEITDEDCERITVGDMRANDEDEAMIPESRDIELYEFNMGDGTDRVDYSHETGFVVAVVNFNDADDAAGNPTHVLVNQRNGDLWDDWNDLGHQYDILDDEGDRIDLLRNVEQIVASQYDGAEGIGGVIDLTQSDRAISIEYSYGTETSVPALDRIVRNVHLQDLTSDTPIDEMNFLEYHADDLIVTPGVSQVSAFWTRIEGSDNAEKIELTDYESQVNHVFNLRGGNNEVNYNELTKSINLYINEISPVDEDDPLGSGLILADVYATDGDGAELSNWDEISSYNSTNCVSAGSLRIEASQDAEDSVTFEDDFDKYYTLLKTVSNSNEIVITRIDNTALTITLTGFEYLNDADSDDIYDMSAAGALDRVFNNLTLFDNVSDDRDTLKVGNDAIDRNASPADTISLENLNDEFVFDWDVLDITAVTKDDLLIVGDGGGGRDTTTTPVDGQADDVVVGNLSLIDSITGFQDVWLTNASVTSSGTEFRLDTIAGQLQDGDGDAFFTFDGRGINASSVTGSDLTLTARSATSVELVGGAGADSITGGGGNDRIIGGAGNDTLDGGLVGEVRQIQLEGILDGTNEAVTLTLDGFVLTLNEVALIADTDPDLGDNLDILAGAGSSAVGAALAALVTANLDEINDGVRFGGTSLVSAIFAGDLLTFTFAKGADVVIGDTIVVADTDGGTFASSVETVVTDGGDGGDDTFVFGKTAAANGVDTINGFIAGVGGDILEFDAFLGAAPGALVSDDTPDSGEAGDVALVNNSGSAFTAATLAARFTGITASQKSVVLEYNGTVADEDAKVWYAHDADADGTMETGEVTLVGIVTGGGDFAWDISNF